ncbi:MAG: VWA domain-containing protein [Gammaproteobacteria bacterium]|nr:hypothetical protein [Chromatiales bacterium]MDP7153864.1 VWA domain-containing protein [Gammaproteobacteria bacterium]
MVQSSPTTQTASQVNLLTHIVRFSRELGAAGIPINTANLIDLCRCFSYVDISCKRDFHAAARANLISSHDDFARFDRMFEAFWQKTVGEAVNQTNNDDPQDEDSVRKIAKERECVANNPDEEPAPGERQSSHIEYSPDEVLAKRDLGSLNSEELQQARRLMAKLLAVIANHRSRRRVPAHSGRVLDFRCMLRRSTLDGQDLCKLLYRQRRIRKTKLILLCDVSGSMERYSRFLIQFICALRHELPDVEVAVFSTRLTVLTPQLASQGSEETLRRFSDRVPDWAGGTDIGRCISAFNRHFAPQMLRSRTIVVILSDGWDRGDAGQMRTAIQDLRRNVQKLIWLNPLLGNEGYQPLCRGIKTALPHLDYFLPAHNLDSLGALVELLREIWR